MVKPLPTVTQDKHYVEFVEEDDCLRNQEDNEFMCDNEGNMFQYDKENEGMIIDVNHNIVSQRIVQYF